MAESPINVLSLAAGAGGLDLALKLALGNARLVCAVEIEAFAAAILAARMDAGELDDAPIWSDARTFDGRPWRRRVHLLTAGYPCQPFSNAGKRKGAEDPRHLFPHVERIIDESEPDAVFLENVEGHISLGLREVLGSLRGLGYAPEAGLFSAAETGARQIRKRVFILAVRTRPVTVAHCSACGDGDGPFIGFGDGEPAGQLPLAQQDTRAGAASRTVGVALGDPDCPRLQTGRSADAERSGESERAERPMGRSEGAGRSRRNAAGTEARDASPGVPCAELGEASGARRSRGQDARAASLAHRGDLRGRLESERDGGGLGDAIGGGHGGLAQDEERGEVGRVAAQRPSRSALDVPTFVPGPQDADAWRAVVARDASLVPALRGMADELAGRVDRLRLGGNGVHPLAGAHAFRTLASVLAARGHPIAADLIRRSDAYIRSAQAEAPRRKREKSSTPSEPKPPKRPADVVDLEELLGVALAPARGV